MKKHILIFIVLMLASVRSYSEPGICIYQIYSDNNQYYAEIINYEISDFYGISDLVGTLGSLLFPYRVFTEFHGQTKIYEAKSKKLLQTYNFGLKSRDTYLSNDGKSLLVFNLNNDSIYHYKNGSIDKSYSFYRILKTKDFSKSPILSYNYYDDIADSTLKFGKDLSIISNSDTLYFLTVNSSMIKFSISSGDYLVTNEQSEIQSISQNSRLRKIERKKYEVKEPDLPRLKSGKTIIEELNSKFPNNFYDHKANIDYSEQKFYHYLYLACSISRDGKLTPLDNYYIKQELSSEIIEYLQNLEYENLNLPIELDNWVFKLDYVYENKDERITKQEQIYNKSINNIRLNADSLDGLYIPCNIEECLSELDKILPEQTLAEIDSMSDEKELRLFIPDTLITILRCWSYSRLYEKYFKEKQIHENKEYFLLYVYYRHRHHQELNLDELLSKYKSHTW